MYDKLKCSSSYYALRYDPAVVAGRYAGRNTLYVLAAAEIGIGTSGMATGGGLAISGIGTVVGVPVATLSAGVAGHGALVMGRLILVENTDPLPGIYFASSSGTGGSRYTTPEARKKHILDGDSTGGAHAGRHGDPKVPSNKPSRIGNKTYFPRSWSDADIISAAEEAAELTHNARSPASNNLYVHQVVSITRNGVTVEVRVITSPSYEIWTAYPIIP